MKHQRAAAGGAAPAANDRIRDDADRNVGTCQYNTSGRAQDLTPGSARPGTGAVQDLAPASARPGTLWRAKPWRAQP